MLFFGSTHSSQEAVSSESPRASSTRTRGAVDDVDNVDSAFESGTSATTPDGTLTDGTLPAGARVEPWKRSWFYRAPGETPTLVWILGIHLASIVGLVLLPMPSWWLIGAALALCWLGGLGTTVAYHRALAHKSVVLNPMVERALVFFAMFNGSGNPLTWVANHRYHHAHADKDGDVSSPRHGGFWWAHLRWLWQAEQAQPARYCPDLVKRNYDRWGRAQVPVLALSVFGGLLLVPFIGWIGGLVAFLVLGPLRLVFALHVQCSVNSLCHLGPLGLAHGSALNVAWIMPFHLGQGENWHANHHVCANDARLGQRWWQVDAGWWAIALMERCGLARDVRGRKTSTALQP